MAQFKTMEFRKGEKVGVGDLVSRKSDIVRSTLLESSLDTEKTEDNNTDLLDSIQKKLLESSGAVSSQKSEIDKLIGESIAGLQTGQAGREAGTKAEFERARIETAEAGQRGITSALEERRGFATSTALLQQMKESNEKSLRDLDLRERQALVSGQVETASQIASLKLNQLQFGIQAEQQAFSNLLAGAQFTLQKEGIEQSKKQFEDQMVFQREQFKFTQQSTIADLATEFGVDIDQGETLESIVNKVKPFAAQKRQAELSKLLKDSKDEQQKINLDSQLTNFIVENGLSPAEAASNALALASNIGIKVTKDDFESAYARAQEIFDENKIREDKAKAEAKGKGLSGFFESLRERRVSEKEGRSKDEVDIFGGLGKSFEENPLGTEALNFFGTLFQ